MTTVTPGQSDTGSNATSASFDPAKWNALVEYDKDIALVAEKLRPLGQKWLFEFASSYLALNDKKYLPELEQKIIAAAKAETEESERLKARAEEQRKAYLQEQERLAQEIKEQQERRAEARQKQFKVWRDRLWGNGKAKIRTMSIGSAVLLIIALIVVPRVAEQRKLARTAIFVQAAARGDWAQARELVEEGVDVNAQPHDGGNPLLMRAIIMSNGGEKASLDAVKSLLEHGVAVNVHGDAGLTPLHIANDPAVVSLLLSHGAAVDALDYGGATALHGAACEHFEKVNQLIASHADVNMKTNAGAMPLHPAVYCGSLPVVKALIEHGAQVNVTNPQGKTPLALSVGHPEIGAYLKAHGATGEIPVQAQVSNVEQDTPGQASSSVPPTTANGGFESYAVPIYSGSIVSPNFRSAPKSYSMFRTVISQGARQGVNFAGHYTVIVVGCGAGCRSVVLVDAKSGKIFGFPLGGEGNYMLALDYHADSSLIKAHWQVEAGDIPACVGQEFVLIGTSFKPFHEERQPGRCTSSLAPAQQAVPPLSGHVIDRTGTLSAPQLQPLERKLATFEQSRGAQIVVLLVPTTQPEDIVSYANRVANVWKIGRKDIGDGLLLIVAKDDHKVRIEVAKTLEGAIPDLAAKHIIDQAITPRFKQGDFAGGLDASLDQIMARITGGQP